MGRAAAVDAHGNHAWIRLKWWTKRIGITTTKLSTGLTGASESADEPTEYRADCERVPCIGSSADEFR